jgi:hypothetical protein
MTNCNLTNTTTTCNREGYALRRVNTPCARSIRGEAPFASDAFPTCSKRTLAVAMGLARCRTA